MVEENLSEKVQKAKEAVEGLEEPLKTEAFKKVLDKLLNEGSQSQPMYQEPLSQSPYSRSRPVRRKRQSIPGKLNKSNQKLKEESGKRKKELAEMINRTEHTIIHKFQTTLIRSLYVLKIMQDKGEDGLTPPEVAHILREVFRIKARNEAVSVALKDAHKYVDRSRITIGKATAYVYKIMRSGEDYLKNEMEKLGDSHVPETNEGVEPD